MPSSASQWLLSCRVGFTGPSQYLADIFTSLCGGTTEAALVQFELVRPFTVELAHEL